MNTEQAEPWHNSNRKLTTAAQFVKIGEMPVRAVHHVCQMKAASRQVLSSVFCQNKAVRVIIDNVHVAGKNFSRR